MWIKLAIENTSVALDERGVPTADHYTLQTSVESIFIAGDASNQIPLLHEAADQGRIAGDNATAFLIFVQVCAARLFLLYSLIHKLPWLVKPLSNWKHV